MGASRLSLLLAGPLAALAGCAPAQASLTRFEATLARQNSATAALGAWCAAKAIATPPTIVARSVRDNPAPEPADARALLAAAPDETLGYRHVRLICGDAVLSEAHNWYVRARLTAAMNYTLDTSETPFGRAVADLKFTRQRLSETRGASADCPDGTILSHRALLSDAGGRPFSLVVECYTAANLTN